MDARKREIHLPIPVIQHIQSFLTCKRAAQTTILSKSWYNAWLTRPNLNFNERSFHKRRSLNFWDFLNRTVQRYEESNLNIKSFKLLLDFLPQRANSETSELINKVLELCIDGSYGEFRFPYSDYIYPSVKFPYGEFQIQYSDYALPSKVLETKRLVGLFVLGCKINRPICGNVECSRLKSIKLDFVHIDDDLFRNTFPCLEYLTLVNCNGHKELDFLSISLKRISILERTHFRGNFNVPNIQKFTFSGPSLPSLSLTEPLREWESDISVNHLYSRSSEFWFVQLRGLLRNLNESKCKVSLTIGFYAKDCDHYCVENRGGEKILRGKVENLRLSLPWRFFGYDKFLGSIFRVCRPKVITQYWFPKSCWEEQSNNDLIRTLVGRLIQERSAYCYLYCALTLKDVEVEIFEEPIGEWRPLHWETLLDDSREIKQKIRFLLEWCED